MVTRNISDFFIYRWRYIVGYTLIGSLLAGLLLFAGMYVPGGISSLEVSTAVKSEALSLSNPATLAVTNLPFNLLQATAFFLFGISDFTIKLPSLFLGLLSAAGLILLLRRWFRPNIAVLTSLIAITTGQFLFVAQSGGPGILYIFWPILLLALGTQVTRAKHGKLLWKLLFAAVASLSLYTPLGIYPLIAIALTVALHPHLRNIIRRLSTRNVVVSFGVGALVVAPLMYIIVKTPGIGMTLLGIPEVWPPNLAENSLALLRQYFLFWEPSTTTLMTPVFGFGSALIILLGLYRLFITRETTRSYLVMIWIVSLVPALFLNPQFTSVTFVPAVLLLAAGLTSLISYWYRLFPLNPYARITGLIPIIILVATLLGSGIDRYVYGYHYSPDTAVNFSKDLRLLPKETQNLVVSSDELPFYQAVSNSTEGLTVTIEPKSVQFTATRAARGSIGEGYQINRIITTARTNESDRLYIYKKTDQ